MPILTEEQRQHMIALLENNEDLPAEFKTVLFPPERQEYELIYAGKEREEDIIAETMAVPLQPIRAFGGNGLHWHNMLIFGDNLQAMKTLLQMKERGHLLNADGTSGIKLIYIDPPFATKQEFKGSQEEKAYQDKVVGAQFLEFIRKRLVFLKGLLSDEGSILVHIDWKKGHYIKLILDEVFGEENFRNEILVRRTQKNLQQQFTVVKQLNVAVDSVFWYSKHPDTRFPRIGRAAYLEPNTDNWHGMWKGVDRPTMRYKLLGQSIDSGQWMWSKERSLKAVENYHKWEKNYSEIMSLYEYWVETGKKLEFIRLNLSSSVPEYWVTPKNIVPADSKWLDIPAYGDQKFYPTCKSEVLLQRIISHLSESGDLVLDAFAGSGTTLAVAEKLGRRWIGIDCGKLAIYTIQKRLLHLKSKIGNTGKPLKPKPFTLYNAGLYDFAQLRNLPWEGWRSYALNLFQCKDAPHKIGGIELDGYRGNDDVLIFNHRLSGGVVLDYGFIDDLYSKLRNKVGARFFIIAPAASVNFLEDYVEKGHTRFYILRIPYSIINELHRRDFSALVQPADETEVNATVEAVGFDFIRQPKVECEYSIQKLEGEMFENAVVKIKTFQSRALAKGASQKSNLETLSMILVDFDYPYDGTRKANDTLSPFEVDASFYANDIRAAGWKILLPVASLGKSVMLVYVDIYGNEYTEIKMFSDFVGAHNARSTKVS